MIADLEIERYQDLVTRLGSHDIHYLGGGGGKHEGPPAALAPLLLDLARARSSRLRSALVALLLRHPGYAPVAEEVARDLPTGDPARTLLRLSVLVAAALQSEWSFTLDLYLAPQPCIRADHLAAELGLPSPYHDFGRPCLAAASLLHGKGDLFPVNYGADWENAAHRLLAQLAQEARSCGA